MKKIFIIIGFSIIVLIFSGCPSPIDSEPVEYTVSYNANGADSGSVPEDQTKIEGRNLALALNSGALTKIGFYFMGWNTALDGSGTDYNTGGSYTGDANLTLYAKWIDVSSSFVVSYNSNGADSGTSPNDQIKIEGVDLNLAQNSRSLGKSGFNIIGWNTESDGTGIDYAFNAIYDTDADLTLFSKWQEISLVGTWDSVGNDIVMVFDADRTWDLIDSGSPIYTDCPYSYDLSVNPHFIDIDLGGGTLISIYEFTSEDQFRMENYLGGDRPTDFTDSLTLNRRP